MGNGFGWWFFFTSLVSLVLVGVITWAIVELVLVVVHRYG